MHKVIVTVGDGGKMTIKVEGVKGGGCQQVTKDLEAALGKVAGSQKTAEFYEKPNVVTLKQGQG
jgi:hypothetical protein